MSASDSISVQLVCAWPERAYVFKATVSRGTTAAELFAKSRVSERFSEFANEPQLGVFGRKVEGDYVLADGDRVEVLRDLRDDPKEMRRRRAAQAKPGR